MILSSNFGELTIPKGVAMRRTTRISDIILACFLLIGVGCATMPATAPQSSRPHHDRVIAIGDIHGSYSGLVSIMKEAALIDGDNRWTGGNTLLVQTGDVLDRGEDIRRVLDLLMALQTQAEAAGGKVVALLGNHEVMNIFGSRHYVNPKAYKSFAGPASEEKRNHALERWQSFFGASAGPEAEDPETLKQNWLVEHPPGFVEYAEAMGPDGRYGKWLRSLPAVFRYGGSIFLHGGISPEYADLPLSGMTEAISLDIETFDRSKSYLMELGFADQSFTMSEMMAILDGILAAAETEELPAKLQDALPRLKEIKDFFSGIYETSPLMVDAGPLWFRGFAQWPDEQLVSYLPKWLEKNSAWRVIVSHTPQPDGRIRSRLNGSTFLIDTGMLSEHYTGGRASALEIRDDDVTAIYEAGERVSFPPPEIDYGPLLVWKDAGKNPLPFNTLRDIEQFLATAKHSTTETITVGVNKPLKVLLEKDGVKVNAIFRHESESVSPNFHDGGPIDEKRYFLDSYVGEIAAYEMNCLLGLNNMPPTVYRPLEGKQGTLQLWAEDTMPDRERARKNILPPESRPWNRQMWDMRVFDNLINNTDRNQTNILIDPNWRLILIDHTRSFARDRSLPKPEQVIHCSRGLWHALRHLDEAEVKRRLSPYLNQAEIETLFVRWDRLILRIRDLIDREGEENVLF